MNQNNFTKKQIAIGCDHAGLILKEHLKAYLITTLNYEVLDQGCYSTDRVDYPDFGIKVAQQVLQNQMFGVVVCGSGIGISMVLNKNQGIKAAVCHDSHTAQHARERLDCNVIAFGERVTGNEVAQDALKTFLETKFNATQQNIQLCQKLHGYEEKNLANFNEKCEICYIMNIDANTQILGFEDIKACSSCGKVTNYALETFPYFKDNVLRGFLSPQIDCIIENKLYLGNKNGSRSKQLLEKYKITDILVAGNGLKEVFAGDYNYKTLKIDDSPDQEIESVLQEAVEFINQGQVVFVHCYGGVSRSSSMVIAYLIKYQQMNFQDALNFVKQKRSKANPNDYFKQQLQNYETKIKQ